MTDRSGRVGARQDAPATQPAAPGMLY